MRGVALVKSAAPRTPRRALRDLRRSNELRRAVLLGASTGPVEGPLDEGEAAVTAPGSSIQVSDYPALMRTADMLAEDHTKTKFEASLEALLDPLDLLLSQ